VGGAAGDVGTDMWMPVMCIMVPGSCGATLLTGARPPLRATTFPSIAALVASTVPGRVIVGVLTLAASALAVS
jgi:hypothetical protein